MRIVTTEELRAAFCPSPPGNEPPSFSALPDFKSRRSASFGCSVALHAATIFALVTLVHPEKALKEKPFLDNYSVRYMQLQLPPPPPREPEGGSPPGAPHSPVPPAPKTLPAPPKPAAGNEPAPLTARAAPKKFELPKLQQPKPVQQTLLQFELPPEMAPRDIRVPAVVIWDGRASHLPRPPAKKFIAPPKQLAKVQPSVMAEPKLELPNQQRNIAAINFDAPRITDVPRLPLPPSSTTPIRVNVNSSPTGEIPQSTAATSGQHEPANIISIPDMPLPSVKALLVPPVNQVADAHMAGTGDSGGGSSNSAGKAATGPSGPAGSGGAGKAMGAGAGGVASGNGSGAGPSGTGSSSGAGGNGSGASGPGGQGTGLGTLTGTGTGPGTGSGNGAGAAPGNGAGSGTSNGSGTGTSGAVTRIARSKDGHFASVTLGSSGSAQYPESLGVLSGRLVYTVHLRVGTKKSWILQYCLPLAVEKTVKVRGSATPVEAPYPYLILRPDLDFTPDMDHVVVHGIVNSQGKFEQLTVVGGTDFPQEHLLLSSLGLWEFRPASRDGQPTTVEILLIIPREEV